MAGDGSGNSRAERGKILILFGFVRIPCRLVNHLGEHMFQSPAVQADRSRLHGQSLRPEGLNLESVTLQFLGDARKYNHLFSFELDQKGHQQSLALNVFHLAIAKNFLK